MKIYALLILILFCFTGFAQTPLTNDVDEDLLENFVDADSVDYDSYTKKTSSFKALFNGKPGRTILYGMLFPGGGQLYNKDYWKVPIAWVAEGAGIWAFVYIRREFNRYDAAYINTILGDEESSYRGISGIDSLDAFRKQFQKWSEQAGVAMIAIHLLVAVESYIDRHLSIFDIDEDLSFKYSAPGILDNSRISGISLKYSF